MVIPIPIPSPKEIKEFFEALYKKWVFRSAENKASALAEGRKNSALYEFLQRLYPKSEFLVSGDKLFPDIIIRPGDDQYFDPESVLGDLAPLPSWELDRQLMDAGRHYIDFLRWQGGPLYDWPTFCMSDIRRENGAVKIDCWTGKYFESLQTSEMLEWEALSAFSKEGVPTLENDLPARSRAHTLAGVKDPVLHPVGRAAAIGISTLVLFNRGDGYAALLSERSRGGVVIHADMCHVIPSFTFQPTAGDMVKEFSVVHNIFREYLEELFHLKEAKEAPSVLSYDYFYGNRNLCYLRELLDSGKARIYFTGVAMDALNLRPEICTLLLIHESQWYGWHRIGTHQLDRIEFNEESKKISESNNKPNVVSIGEVSTRLEPTTTDPAGAAAICLGLEAVLKKNLVPFPS
jgi:hypothetical protein